MYYTNLHLHFIGIGGSGMSGIAEILVQQGFSVSGSDLAANAACRRLASLGVQIAYQHRADNVPPQAALVVYSSAVDLEINPEIVEARRRGLPILRRAEVLAELVRLKYGIAVAGSHGKTTTTSMIAAICDNAKLDPTVVIGGQVGGYGSGGRHGLGRYLVAETDESDRSFLLLKPTIAVVTNIDAEHIQAYASLAELEESFEKFVQAVPFYGLAVLCVDDPRVREIGARFRGRWISYGFSPEAVVRAERVRVEGSVTSFSVLVHGKELFEVHLPIPGVHMAKNALAAIAVGIEIGVEPSVIRDALNHFAGVRRRLEILVDRPDVVVMNDYAHHPTEIRATLAAVRAGWGSRYRRIRAVFQPHRYTRTRDCFADFLGAFNDADEIFITEIYAACEEPIVGITGQGLTEAVQHPQKFFVEKPADAAARFVQELREGDFLVFLGAGSVGAAAEETAHVLLDRQVAA